MAHFAQLDENNKVLRVIVISNDDILDENGNESEEKGIELCKFLENDPNSRWVQTSYNARFRRQYAGPGKLYDPERNIFYNPEDLIAPFPSWIFNEETFEWEAPIPMPTDHSPNVYGWDEFSLTWRIPPKPEQPYPSWIWDDYYYEWKAPKLFSELLPEEIEQGYYYVWDEETISWKLMQQNR